jgi:hypothetical protein
MEIKKRPMLGYLRSFSETGVESAEFPFVSFEDIVAATDNFADSKQIGRGGFGKVYKVITTSFMYVVSAAHALFFSIIIVVKFNFCHLLTT